MTTETATFLLRFHRPMLAFMREICSEPGFLAVTVKRSGRDHIPSLGALEIA
jgi:hypothetical protein